MLRRTIAVFLLAIMGAGFYFWSGLKKDVAETCISLLDKLYTQTQEQNWNDAEQTILELEKDYEKKQKLINILTNHELADALYNGLAQLKTAVENKNEIYAGIIITDLKAKIKNGYESGLLKLENIL